MASVKNGDVEKLALIAPLSDRYAEAIHAALANGIKVAVALGAPVGVVQEAVERALMTTAVGTFAERVKRRTGKPASTIQACKEMQAMAEHAGAKIQPATPTLPEAMPLPNPPIAPPVVNGGGSKR